MGPGAEFFKEHMLESVQCALLGCLEHVSQEEDIQDIPGYSARIVRCRFTSGAKRLPC